MILKSLSIKRFRRFADFSMDLSPGLNVIQGLNEAGKSTLHDALLMGLFAKPTSRSAEVVRNRSWFSTSLPEIVVGFESDGEVFTLAKDFESESLILTRQRNDEVVRDWSSVEAILGEAMGLSSATLFKATAFVGHGDLEAVTSKRDLSRNIGDELQRVVTGGAEDVAASSVLKKLDDRIAHVQKGMQAAAKEPGEIRAAMNRIAALGIEIASGKEALARIERAEDALKLDEEELARVKQDLEDRRTLLTRYNRRQQLKRDFDVVSLKEDELDKTIAEAKRLEETIARVKDEMAAYGIVAELDSAMIGQLASLNGAVGRWQESEANEQREVDRLEEGRTKAVSSASRIWLLAIAAIFFFAGLAGAFVNFYLLTASIFGICLVVLNLALRRYAWISRSDAVVAAKGRLEAVRFQRTSAGQELEERLSRFNGRTYEELLRDHDGCSDLAMRFAQERARLGGILSGRTVEELEVLRRGVSKLRRDKEEALEEPDLVGPDIDPISFQRIERDLALFEASRAELDRAVAKNRAILDSSSTSIVDIHRLEEEKVFWESQLEAAQRRLAVYKLARIAIEEAMNSVLVSAKDVLQAELGGYLAAITGGRYQDVSVDEKTLSFEVYSREKGEGSPVNPQTSLSRGAQDQFYLAARLSLVKVICSGRRPPIVLDDPFVNFDESRLENTMTLCQTLARENQILLFTCNEGYRKWADNFVTLPAP